MFSAVEKTVLQKLNRLAFLYNASFPRAIQDLPPSSLSMRAQEHRIRRALDVGSKPIPRVNEASLIAYHRYLSANLLFPFAAHYPWPTDPWEAAEDGCLVLELLDPRKYVGDEFHGIYCKTCKGRHEVNLPLLKLYLPESSPAFQLIEDYWHWFWSWK